MPAGSGHQSPRITLWLLLVGLALLGWFVLPRFDHDRQAVSIAVSRTPLSTPIYIADALGFFREEGLEVSLDEVIGGRRSFDRVVNGEADFGTTSDSVMVFQSFERDDFVNLATFVQSDNDVKIITREQSGIGNGADLRGRRVAVTPGTASEYFLSAYLALEQVAQSEVTSVQYQPEDMPEALFSEAVDAIVTWEPFSYQAMQVMSDRVQFLPTRNLYTLTFNLIARRDYVAKHRTAVHGMLRAIKRAIEYIAEKPLRAQEIMRQRLELDDAFIAWVLRDYLFKLSLSRSLILNLENQARWAIHSGLTDSRQLPDFTALIKASPLRTIQPHAVSVGD